MDPKTISTQPLDLLAAAASPGSALALHFGAATFEPGLMQRTSGCQVSPAPSLKAQNWLVRALDWLEGWAWERERRAQEAYLAQSYDLHDLERRMRELDGGTLSRAQALR
jgi:hypothetical protein